VGLLTQDWASEARDERGTREEKADPTGTEARDERGTREEQGEPTGNDGDA
jgi:hypothetical protein